MAGGIVEKPTSGAPVRPKVNYLNETKGLKNWLVTLDHKRIALMYLAAVSVALLLGGFWALVLRTELLGPQDTILSNQWYNRAFTLHGAVMVFLFIIPGIPASLGNFILPMQLGAKDLALPRINLLSWYLYVIGLIFFSAKLYFAGLVMVVVFSFGLAIVLATIGLMLVHSKEYLNRKRKETRSKLYRLLVRGVEAVLVCPLHRSRCHT